MRFNWLVIVAAVALAWPAEAQQGPGQGRRGQRGNRQQTQQSDDGQDQQGGRGGQPGFGRGPGGPGGPGGPMSIDRMAEGLAQRLNLDEEQQAGLDVLIAQYEGKQGNPEQMHSIMQQMREARQSNDEAKMDELRTQMEAMRAQREQVMESFLDDVSLILDDQQAAQLQQERDRMAQMRQMRQQGEQMRRLARTLPDELNLSDDQRAQYREIMQVQRQRGDEMREQWRELRPLMEQLREAREAGDEARAAELQAQIDAKRPQPPDPTALLDQIRPILNEEQLAKLDQIAAQITGAGTTSSAKAPALQDVLRAVRKLDLTADQREQVDTIVQDAMRSRREARTSEDRDQLSLLVKSKITAILTAEQTTTFNSLLERGNRTTPQPQGDTPQRGQTRGRSGARRGASSGTTTN